MHDFFPHSFGSPRFICSSFHPAVSHTCTIAPDMHAFLTILFQNRLQKLPVQQVRPHQRGRVYCKPQGEVRLVYVYNKINDILRISCTKRCLRHFRRHVRMSDNTASPLTSASYRFSEHSKLKLWCLGFKNKYCAERYIMKKQARQLLNP